MLMILDLRRWRQEDLEVRVVLGYILSSRAAWALGAPNSQSHSPQIKSNKPTCGWTLPASACRPSTPEMEAEDQELLSSPSPGATLRSAWVTGDPVSNKVENKDNGLLRLSSDLHRSTWHVYTHIQTHLSTRHKI